MQNSILITNCKCRFLYVNQLLYIEHGKQYFFIILNSKTLSMINDQIKDILIYVTKCNPISCIKSLTLIIVVFEVELHLTNFLGIKEMFYWTLKE